MSIFSTKHTLLAIFIIALLAGCASTSSEWGSGEIPDIGVYPPPPAGLRKQRLAVIYFQDKTGGGKKRSAAAADQMTTLMVKTRRFQVIERERLQDVLKEQDMEGIVNPDQMARTGEVLGADLLCYGSVTDFEVKKTKTQRGGGVLRGVGKIVGAPHVGVLDVDFKSSKLDFHIGLDVRIVQSTSGEVLFADSADMRRTETADGMGLNLVGLSVSSQGDIQINNENQGRLLRLALDSVVKKLIPEIDQTYGGK
jgi:curli biogenesis system outer membrane secretion channel CsgG